jgi:hypothetical protein
MNIIILLLFPVLLFSQTSTDEIKVNTFTKYSQHEPSIAVNNSNGEFIVVWTSENQDGDGDGIFAQYFDNSGEKIGEEFQVNSNSVFDQSKPSVAMNEKGIAVIVWAETHPDTTLQDIYCAVYDKDRKKICEDFLVNTTTDKSQNWPDVGIDSQGNFIVVWHSWANDESDRAVCAQRFNSKCEKIGEEFVVNTYTKFSQCLPSIAMNSDGRFIILWQSWGQESFDNQGFYNNDEEQNYGVYAQLFDEDGNRVAEEIHVNAKTEGDQFFSRGAINKNGDIIIVWSSWISNTTNSGDIIAQRFNKNGEKIGEEFIVNSTLVEYQHLPDVAMRDDGSFVIVWSSWKQDQSMEGIFLQRFDLNGKKINQEEQVNIYFDNYQWEPKLVLLPNGNIVVVYSSWQDDYNEYDILLRILKK